MGSLRLIDEYWRLIIAELMISGAMAMTSLDHLNDRPSPWVQRFVPQIARDGEILDLACGRGRHARWLAGEGWRVEAVDRDSAALAGLAGVAGVRVRVADLEHGAWPYAGRHFAGIVVTNYLHRPLLPLIEEALGEGGMLIYETFMVGNERFGRPSNPDFLLRPQELLEVARAAGLRVLAFEEGEVTTPKPAMVQRIAALR